VANGQRRRVGREASGVLSARVSWRRYPAAKTVAEESSSRIEKTIGLDDVR
jgi:hypothetical protein